MPDPQHIAYEFANKAIRAAKSEVTSGLLTTLNSYDASDPDDITNAVRITEQAFDLCHQADRIARQMMGSHTHDVAITELKRRRPGYNDETYRQAISEAFSYASR